jgi:hypothetical protein
MALVALVHNIVEDHKGECLLYENIKAKERYDVTSSGDRASLYALWTRVSSGIGLFCNVIVALAVSMHVSGYVCFININNGQQG